MTIPKHNAEERRDAKEPPRRMETYQTQVIVNEELDEPDLVIRLRGDRIPEPFRNLPLGTILALSVAVTNPPTIVSAEELAEAFRDEEPTP